MPAEQTAIAASEGFALSIHSKDGLIDYGNCCPEISPFPACLRAILEDRGEGFGYRLISNNHATWRFDLTYTFLMGVSGCAFHHSWKPGWQVGNEDIRFLPGDPAASFRRTFKAVGYELAAPESQAGREGLNKQFIIENLIERGTPVIAVGLFGLGTASLILGYDKHGDVLIGRNFTRIDTIEMKAGVHEMAGDFRLTGWDVLPAFFLAPGNRLPLPTREESFRSALFNALEIMRAPYEPGMRHYGSSAYQSWADQLENDTSFADQDIETLIRQLAVHDRAVASLAEARWYGMKFLEMAADDLPEVEESLLDAASCFEVEHDLMWKIWECMGGSGRSKEHALRLADPHIRRTIVTYIRKAREKDIEAAKFLESALNQIPIPN